MLFAIFKLPRTGSTRIAKYLSRAHGVKCFHEILNQYEGADCAGRIRERLESVATKQQCIGFTLNPFKHDLTDDFFDPTPYLGEGQGQVVSLIRESVFEQAVSIWVSTQLKMWPGDSESRMASDLRSFIEQGGVTIPTRKFKRICNRVARQNEDLISFSCDYARRYGMRHNVVTYEGIYQHPHSDLEKLEQILDCTLDRELIAPSGKLLPEPSDWIANFDRLASVYPPGGVSDSND